MISGGGACLDIEGILYSFIYYKYSLLLYLYVLFVKHSYIHSFTLCVPPISQKYASKWTGYFKLPSGVNDCVNVCCPVMDSHPGVNSPLTPSIPGIVTGSTSAQIRLGGWINKYLKLY